MCCCCCEKTTHPPGVYQRAAGVSHHLRISSAFLGASRLLSPLLWFSCWYPVLIVLSPSQGLLSPGTQPALGEGGSSSPSQELQDPKVSTCSWHPARVRDSQARNFALLGSWAWAMQSFSLFFWGPSPPSCGIQIHCFLAVLLCALWS